MNLNIDVYLTATTLRPYININYDLAQPLADDIFKSLRLTFKNGILSPRDR
ncbi:MAG: hypothetical protein P4M11_02430 [Candidatus Pacebacteria bacterium]|nr:hypothetical protein [Candidatus Paceibacterota bacterium]